MTPTNEDLLALADRLDEWREHCGYCGRYAVERNSRGQCICAACLAENNPGHWGAVHYDTSAALRAIVAERQKPHTYVGGEASVTVCPICDIAGCYHIRAAALDVSETPVSDHQQDLLLTTERQAIRDNALDDAAQAASNRAAFFRDAAETASEAGFHALRALHAMRELCLVEIAAAIRLMKGKPE